MVNASSGAMNLEEAIFLRCNPFLGQMTCCDFCNTSSAALRWVSSSTEGTEMMEISTKFGCLVMDVLIHQKGKLQQKQNSDITVDAHSPDCEA